MWGITSITPSSLNPTLLQVLNAHSLEVCPNINSRMNSFLQMLPYKPIYQVVRITPSSIGQKLVGCRVGARAQRDPSGSAGWERRMIDSSDANNTSRGHVRP